MASLDVDSLFTNIPVDETIDLCVENLYIDNKIPPNIQKHDFRSLLNIATKESFFTFNNKFYKQVDSAAMRSPLGPDFANILCVVLKVNGFKIALMISSLCPIDVMLMIFLHCFLLMIM